MEQNTPKFRLRLNLFDGIVLVLALAAAAVLGWMALHPVPASGEDLTYGTVRYTVRLNRWVQGTSALIRTGDSVVDNTHDRALGQIVDIRTEPARMMVVNQAEHRQVLAEIEGYEDILITVESPCIINRYGITVDDRTYTLRVGNMAYLRGEGYMGSGAIESMEIVSIEEGQEVDQ